VSNRDSRSEGQRSTVKVIKPYEAEPRWNAA